MEYDLSVGLSVKITGGKYNGFEGQIAKLCLPSVGQAKEGDTWCSVIINHENQPHELILETHWLIPLHLWTAQRSAVELILKGHHVPQL